MNVEMNHMNNNRSDNNYSYYNVDQYGNQTGQQIAINHGGDPYADPNSPNLMNLNNQPQNNENNLDPNNLNNLPNNNLAEEAAKKEAEAKLQNDKKATVKENPIQKEFKNIFKGNDYYDNNKYRRRLMHLLFYCIVQDLVILEVLWYIFK
jgi:hypothetical protein